MKPRILILDDESGICISLALALQNEYDAQGETDPIKALDRLSVEPFDVVLLDLVLGDYDGLEILGKIRQLAPRTMVIMMTAYGSIRSSVSAIKQGAFSYLTKPLDLDELRLYIQQALEYRMLNDSASYVNLQLINETRSTALVGSSPQIRHILQMIDRFARTDSLVLITGESGTGKSLVAKLLHLRSSRRNFVSNSCSAIAEDMLDEEFFGRSDGTGDVKQGKLDFANGGTLFLDEIGELPLSFQAKLLRVLNERTYSPLGSREIRRFTGRVIATTNRDLHTMTENGQFRRDLYYRLNAVELNMPPLREHREDIPLLCEHFIRNSSILQNKRCPIKSISEEAQLLLNAHDYPGNIRELANAIEYACIVANDDIIRVRDLPYRFVDSHKKQSEDDIEQFLRGKTLQQLENMAVVASYKRHGGKRKLIAEELGISARGLWNKLQENDLN